MKQKYLILVILFFTVSIVIGQSSKNNYKEIQDLRERTKILEGQKENLNKQSELLQKDFEVKASDLNSKFVENKIKIDQDLKTIRLIISVFGIGLIGYLLYLKKFIKKKSEQIAEKRIKDVLENIIQIKKEELVSLINSQDVENRVKENSNILVISETTEDQIYLQEFFDKVGIENIEYVLGNKFEEPSTNIDLILFDDHRITNNQHDLFGEYVSKLTSSEILFVFFGDRFQIQNREKVNFANSKFTLYNQIINTLKFKEIIKN